MRTSPAVQNLCCGQHRLLLPHPMPCMYLIIVWMPRLVRRTDPTAIARVFGTVDGEIRNDRSAIDEKPLPARSLSLRKVAQREPPMIYEGHNVHARMPTLDDGRRCVARGGDADRRCDDQQEKKQ